MSGVRRSLSLLAATLLGAAASAGFGQAIGESSRILVSPGSHGQPEGVYPAGPSDGQARALRRSADDGGRRITLAQSALMQGGRAPDGGFSNMNPGLMPVAKDLGGGGGGGDQRYVDQPINCGGSGWFSNNNSNSNPYLCFEDFVADGRPMTGVEFYGGAYDGNTGGNSGLGIISGIGIEIWTIQGGGACGWTYQSYVGGEFFSVAALNPQFVCRILGTYDSYKFTANFSSALPLNSGQNYMITIYATLANGSAPHLFFWNDTSSPHYNPASSWDRGSGDFARCGPDMAMRTLAGSQTYCQANDCQTTCWFSNLGNNTNPFISLDDFTASRTGDLRRIQVTGGVYDSSSGTGKNFANIGSLYVELYGAQADGGFPCGNWVTTFLGFYQVPLANTSPRYDCTDIFGISHYTFTIELPAGFSLVAGQRYMLGVYGIPVNPNSTELFCWGGTDKVYGFTSWSYNTSTGAQEVCHEVDQAFCIDPKKPCIADFNNDGVVDTRDVIAFLNAWSARKLQADMDYNLIIDTRDVLAFLNLWAAGC